MYFLGAIYNEDHSIGFELVGVGNDLIFQMYGFIIRDIKTVKSKTNSTANSLY